MPKFVALVRGVNVGKAKLVPMTDFRALLSVLGYKNVSMLRNSSNAVFNATEGTAFMHAMNIAAANVHRLKIAIPVIVTSAKNLSVIVSQRQIKTEAQSSQPSSPQQLGNEKHAQPNPLVGAQSVKRAFDARRTS